MINLFESLYLFLFNLAGSHILALLLLSASTVSLLTLLNRLLMVFPARENQVQTIMAPQLAAIRQNYRGAEAQQRIAGIYRRYRYHPILALRSALPLFLQLPFLFAAYHALKDLPALNGQSFWLIKDLARADTLIMTYNILPFIMTGINLLTALLNPHFRQKDKLQAGGIALLFLLLLYRAPAALLIYWSTNNLLFLLKVLWQRTQTHESMPIAEKNSKQLLAVLPEISLRVILPFFLLIIFSNLLEFIADADGLFFYRFSKTIPLLAASIGFYYLTLAHGVIKHKRIWGIIGMLPVLLTALIHIGGLYRIPENRYVIFACLAGLYLALSIIPLVTQIFGIKSRPRVKTIAGGRRFKLRDAALYLACLMIPSLHLAAANPDYLSGLFYPLFLLLPLGIFFLARVLLMLTDWFSTGEKRPPSLNSPYALAFGVLFCLLPVLRAMMQKNSGHDGDFWAILLVMMLLIWLYRRFQSDELQAFNVQALGAAPKHSKTAITTVFIALFVAALGNFSLSLISGDGSSKRNLQEIPPLLENLEFPEKPNIYFFVYDGVPNPRVFREQNLPFEPMQELFRQYGYKIYEDTYTLGNESLNSMAMTLNISAEQYTSMSHMQDVYSGNSVTNLLLRRLGYSSHTLLENYYTGTSAIANQELVTEYFPPKELSDVQSDFFLTLLRGVLQGEFRFDTKGILAVERYSEEDRQNRKQELIRDGAAPKFVLDHFSKPGHSQNSGKCLPNEAELWVARYLEALQYLERDLQALHEHDPEAIAVFIGDHGPALSGDCYVLQNWKLEDITPDLIWDRIGTLIAIHWPDPTRAENYDADLTLNQDIFPVILSYLADNPAPLDLMPERTFSGYELLTRPALKFREGEVLGVSN